MMMAELGIDEGQSRGAGAAVVVAVAAGMTLALMETASILSQSGAALASPLDLGVLLTWLALPYAVLLGGFGLVGGLALSRVVGFEVAFTSTAAGAALLLWVRSLARLGEGTGSRVLLELLLALVAAGAGAAVGLIARRQSGRIWIVAGMAGLALMVFQSRRLPGPFGRALPPPHIALRLLLAGGTALLIVLAVRWTRARRTTAGRPMTWARRSVLAVVGVWLVFAMQDFASLLARAPSAPVAARATDVQAAVDGKPERVDRPNIILISIDTLRADHLSCYGYARPTSPAIDRLAAEGVRFERTASTASFTLPAHASMMTGLFPSSHGATYQNRDPRSFTVRGMGTGYPTLAEILRDNGYDTAGFVSGPLMRRQFGFSRGFTSYDDRYDRLQTARARLLSRSLLFRGMHRAGIFTDRDLDSQRIAPEINERVEGWLRGRKQGDSPFFLFVHYWDPHGPYDPPAPWGGREDGSRISVDYDMDRLLSGAYTLTPAALADTLTLYDGEISYLDRHLGELLETLRRDGTLNRSLVILTSDHGESFGEHAHWEHSRVLYEDLLHVPFIVRLPGALAAGTVVKEVIAQPTDILPMALSAAGLPMPEGIEGRDLTPWIDEVDLPSPDTAGVRAPGLAFAELDRNVDWPKRWGSRFDRDLVAVRTLRWKLIQSSTGQEELYDLERDPGETTDLSAIERETTGTLRALAEAWRRALRAREGDGGAEEIDEGLRENLRSLGYVQ